jgi:hypothetical protein
VRRPLLALVLLVLAAASCSDDGPSTAADLETGDCVAGDVEAVTDEVEVVDCDEEHVLQAMGTFEAAEGDFPGDEELAAQGFAQCQGTLFETFVGIPYVESATIYASWLTPDADAWDDGERTVVCVAHTQDRSPTTGSYEGAGLGE